MSENKFGEAPLNGAQVTITPSGSEITPHRVTAKKNGVLVFSGEYTLHADAERVARDKRKELAC